MNQQGVYGQQPANPANNMAQQQVAQPNPPAQEQPQQQQQQQQSMPGFNANFGQMNQQVAAVDMNNSNLNQEGQSGMKSETVSENPMQEQHQQPTMPIQSNTTTNMEQANPTNTPNTSVMNVNQTSVNAFDAFARLSMGDTTEIKPKSEDNTATTAPTKASPLCNSSRFSEGSKAVYRDSQNNISVVNIIKIHLDDDLQPFYTIQMSDGREKQTDDAHLEPSSSEVGNEAEQNKVATEENVKNVDICDTVTNSDLSPEIQKVVETLKQLTSEQMMKVEKFISELTKEAELKSDSINAAQGNAFSQIQSPDQPTMQVVHNHEQELAMQHNANLSNLPTPSHPNQTVQHSFIQQGQEQIPPSHQSNHVDQHQGSLTEMGHSNYHTQQILSNSQSNYTNESQIQMQQGQFQNQVPVQQSNNNMVSPQMNGVNPNSEMTIQNPGGHGHYQKTTQPNVTLPTKPQMAPSQQPQPMIEKQGNPFDGW